jgi:hypothetical protein
MPTSSKNALVLHELVTSGVYCVSRLRDVRFVVLVRHACNPGVPVANILP